MRVAVASIQEAADLVQRVLAGPLGSQASPVGDFKVAFACRGRTVTVQFSRMFMLTPGRAKWVRVSVGPYENLYRDDRGFLFAEIGKGPGPSNLFYETGDELLAILQGALALLKTTA